MSKEKTSSVHESSSSKKLPAGDGKPAMKKKLTFEEFKQRNMLKESKQDIENKEKIDNVSERNDSEDPKFQNNDDKDILTSGGKFESQELPENAYGETECSDLLKESKFISGIGINLSFTHASL